jgi:cell division protein FtsB
VGRVALLVVLAIVAGLYVQHAMAYLSVRSQLQSQNLMVRRLTNANAALERQQRQLNDPASIVLLARRLGMVRPGERSYVISGLPNK